MRLVVQIRHDLDDHDQLRQTLIDLKNEQIHHNVGYALPCRESIELRLWVKDRANDVH